MRAGLRTTMLIVFLVAGPVATAAAEGADGTAAWRTIARVLASPRCLNCHPGGDTPTQADDMHRHRPPVQRGTHDAGIAAMRCTTCHDQPRAALGQAPRAIHQIGLEQRSYAWPVRLEGRPPSRRPANPRDGRQIAGGVAGTARHAQARAVPHAQAHLPAHARDRRRADRVELVLEVRQGSVGGRREEVRDVAVRWHQAEQRQQIETANALPDGANPGQVHGRLRRVAQCPQRDHELPHGRDREAQPGEVCEPELVADHLAQTKSISPGMASRKTRLHERELPHTRRRPGTSGGAARAGRGFG